MGGILKKIIMTKNSNMIIDNFQKFTEKIFII